MEIVYLRNRFEESEVTSLLEHRLLKWPVGQVYSSQATCQALKAGWALLIDYCEVNFPSEPEFPRTWPGRPL